MLYTLYGWANKLTLNKYLRIGRSSSAEHGKLPRTFGGQYWKNVCCVIVNHGALIFIDVGSASIENAVADRGPELAQQR